jgi:Icc-related predicted phosphoesterase
MLIAAVADIHSPRYFDVFVRAVEDLRINPDLFLIAGDVVHRGVVEEYEKVYNVLFGKINCPIIACFGNNEFDEIRSKLRKRIPEIKFLDDESITLKINQKSVGIIGTLGSLDMPTRWQKAHVPNIESIYTNRIALIENMLKNLKAEFKILLIHYTPTYKILEGENPVFYPSLGCKKMERVLIEQRPDLVITGHAHNGTKHVWVDKVPVFNVALPLNRQIVVIDTEKNLKPGLERFV